MRAPARVRRARLPDPFLATSSVGVFFLFMGESLVLKVSFPFHDDVCLGKSAGNQHALSMSVWVAACRRRCPTHAGWNLHLAHPNPVRRGEGMIASWGGRDRNICTAPACVNSALFQGWLWNIVMVLEPNSLSLSRTRSTPPEKY